MIMAKLLWAIELALLLGPRGHKKMYPIKKNLTKLDLIFSSNVMNMMPAYKDIPDDYPNCGKYKRVVSLWFFKGTAGMVFIPRDGVKVVDALAHISMIMHSFEPKHEHKMAACAWLLNEWFSDVK
jgi:hypothetical protein